MVGAFVMSPRTQLLIFSGLSPSACVVVCLKTAVGPAGIVPAPITSAERTQTTHLCVSFLRDRKAFSRSSQQTVFRHLVSQMGHVHIPESVMSKRDDLVGLKLTTWSGTKMAESFKLSTAFELQGETPSPGIPGF